METDPKTGLPNVLIKKAREEEAEGKLKIQAIEGEQLLSELKGKEGSRLKDAMLRDFEESVDQIGIDLTSDQLYGIAARISYIRNRLMDWGVKIRLGEHAREKLLEKTFGKKII